MFKVVQPLLRLRSGLAGTLVLFLSSFLLTACILTADQSIEGNPNDPRPQDIADRLRSMDLTPRQTTEPGARGIGQQAGSRPQIYLSDGTRPQGASLVDKDDTGASGYDLNFENAPVSTVAKVILGDLLGAGYTIDPRVQGTVTLASVRPIPKADALYVLENALRNFESEREGEWRDASDFSLEQGGVLDLELSKLQRIEPRTTARAAAR